MSWKDEREPSIKYGMGKTDWRGSKVHQNTELWTELMVSQWNSSGTFPRIQHVAAQPQSPRVLLLRLNVTPEKFTGRIIFMSMFNDIVWDAKGNDELCVTNSKTIKEYTSHGDRRTTRKNASQVLNSSDLDQRKSRILSVKIVHKVSGTKWQRR